MRLQDARPLRSDADLKRAFVRSALDLLDSDGAARLSFRGASRRLEISSHAAARWFVDRTELLTQMAAVTLRQLARRIDEAQARASPGAERWHAVSAAAHEYATQTPHRFALCWQLGDVRVEDENWRMASGELCASLRHILPIPASDAGTAMLIAGSLLQGFVALRDCGAIGPSPALKPRAQSTQGLLGDGNASLSSLVHRAPTVQGARDRATPESRVAESAPDMPGRTRRA